MNKTFGRNIYKLFLKTIIFWFKNHEYVIYLNNVNIKEASDKTHQALYIVPMYIPPETWILCGSGDDQIGICLPSVETICPQKS